MSQTVDTLIDAGWIIPVEPRGITLPEHSLAIDGGRIVGLLPTDEAAMRFLPRQHLRLPGHVLLPGLVNLHTHAAMTLLRGLADDRPLMDWLQQHIWPAETRHVSPEFVHDGTLLACAEMLRGGTTCFNDMYFFPDAAARAAIESRMRATLGLIVVEFPSAWAADPDDYLAKGLALRDELHGEPRLDFFFAPHAPYTVSDRSFQRVLTLAEQLDTGIHLHLHETRDEIRQSIEQFGQRPLARLRQIGLLGPELLAVHMVHLDDEEIHLLADSGCHIAHCPTSNLKLASGIARLHTLHEAGINVGLGTDGAASNNRLDLLGEIRLASLLSKGTSGLAEAIDAHTALAMATLHPARALGLDHRIGSLLPGKCADLIAVDLGRMETRPCFDPASHLVHVAGREHVTHVWVDGDCLVEQGCLTHLDEAELLARVQYWQHRVARSG